MTTTDVTLLLLSHVVSDRAKMNEKCLLCPVDRSDRRPAGAARAELTNLSFLHSIFGRLMSQPKRPSF